MNIEEFIPGILEQGLNTAVAVDFSASPSVKLPATVETSYLHITDNSANALAVGPNGTTNPVFNVDASTASAATGIDIVGAAAAGGVAVSVSSSGTNESLTVDAKGTGTITLNGTGTGAVVVGHNLSVDAAGVVTILNNGTGTATSGAVTIDKIAGVATSESLTTAAGGDYTLTVTDTAIAASDIVFASVKLGTSTTGTPAVATVTPAAGSLVIVVQNIHATAAFNGTIVISFMAVKTA